MSILSKKLESIKHAYAGMSTNGYDTRWYVTGCRRVNEIPIVDEDFEVEAYFLNRASNVQKSVWLEGVEVHTRLMSMTLYNRETESSETLNYSQLLDLKSKEMGDE